MDGLPPVLLPWNREFAGVGSRASPTRAEEEAPACTQSQAPDPRAESGSRPARRKGTVPVHPLEEVFGVRRPLVEMVHLPALPGAPRARLPMHRVRERAVRDAELLAEEGMDGLLVENYGDAPYHPRRVPQSTVAAMAVVAARVPTKGWWRGRLIASAACGAASRRRRVSSPTWT